MLWTENGTAYGYHIHTIQWSVCISVGNSGCLHKTDNERYVWDLAYYKNVLYANDLKINSFYSSNNAMLVTPIKSNHININKEINQYATVFSVNEMIEIEKSKYYEKLSECIPYVLIEVIYFISMILSRNSIRFKSKIGV